MTLKEELELMRTSLVEAEKKVYEEFDLVIKQMDNLYTFIKAYEEELGKDWIAGIKVKEKK